MNPFFKKFLGISLSKESKSNFIILPYPVKKFLKAHLPFEEDFITLNNINYRHIIILIASLCYRFFYLTIIKREPIMLNLTMRGYEGPSKKKSIVDEAFYYSTPICIILNEDLISKEEIINAFEYLENKNQNNVNIFDFGTLKIFINSSNGYYYIDYSVIVSILQNLFNNIPLKSHGFRGNLLEEAINLPCYLPTTPCKGIDNTSKQIDFSCLIGDTLIIGECKVVARRQSFFNGSYQAIKLREDKVIDKGLDHIDDKAQWLLNHLRGTNYNITKIKNILPIAISPFVEFIHSKKRKCWINETTPRVLSLSEFIDFIKSFDKNQVRYNLLSIPS